MSTPQNDAGWAGWAISSFTNKINAASGEMQSKSSASQAPPLRSSSTDGRPSLPVAQSKPKTSTSVSNLHRQAVAGSTAPVLTRTSTEQFFTDAQDEDDEIDDAWGEMEEDPFFDAPSTKSVPAPVSTFDDGGEPDFEGWLNAQAKAKSKAPLPKGLAKPTATTITTTTVNGRMPVTRTTTTGAVGSGAGVKKVASTAVAKPNVVAPKVIDTKPKEAADDDWGDAWD